MFYYGYIIVSFLVLIYGNIWLALIIFFVGHFIFERTMISHIDKFIEQNEKDRRELSMRITELEKKAWELEKKSSKNEYL